MIARRSISIVIALALLLVAGAIAIAGPGEGDFVSLINADRQANGLDPLSVLSGLTTYARSHSEKMAADGQIYHSTSGQLRSMADSVAPGWQRLGENVGVGGSVSSLHAAFMNSPGHRANILGDYTHLGIGTVESDGRLYVTEIFVKLPGGSTTTTTTTTTSTSVPETTTTAAPTTTTAPTTTAAPSTTVAPTTSAAPTTSTVDTTPPSTEEPTTTVPATTEPTATTEAPTTTTSETTEGTPATTEAPTTIETSTTTAPTTTIAPSTTAAGSGSIPTSGPNAPGAADTIRLVAGIVLGVSVVFLLLARRRRGGIPLER